MKKSLYLFFVIFLACQSDDTLTGSGTKAGNADPPLDKGYLLTGVEIKAIEKVQDGDNIRYFYTDTLKTRLVFDIYSKYNKITDDEVGDGNTNDEQVPAILNPVDPDSSSFEFNKKIEYHDLSNNSIDVLPFTNLLKIDKIKSAISFPRLSPYIINSITLDTNLFYIPAGEYKIIAKWQTVDGEILSDTLSVFIELQYTNLPQNTIIVPIRNSEVYEFRTNAGGDEEGAIIKTQAEHFEISTIVRNSATNWEPVYRYRPENNFSGNDYVEIEIHRNNTGGSDSLNIELVKISFVVIN